MCKNQIAWSFWRICLSIRAQIIFLLVLQMCCSKIVITRKEFHASITTPSPQHHPSLGKRWGAQKRHTKTWNRRDLFAYCSKNYWKLHSHIFILGRRGFLRTLLVGLGAFRWIHGETIASRWGGSLANFFRRVTFIPRGQFRGDTRYARHIFARPNLQLHQSRGV